MAIVDHRAGSADGAIRTPYLFVELQAPVNSLALILKPMGRAEFCQVLKRRLHSQARLRRSYLVEQPRKVICHERFPCVDETPQKLQGIRWKPLCEILLQNRLKGDNIIPGRGCKRDNGGHGVRKANAGACAKLSEPRRLFSSFPIN